MVDSKKGERKAPRRSWSVAEKRRIVEMTLRGDASVSDIARQVGVHATSLSHWKRRYHAGELAAVATKAPTTTFLPVSIVGTREEERGQSPRVASVVHMTFTSGATMRIEAALDAPILCALIEKLTS